MKAMKYSAVFSIILLPLFSLGCLKAERNNPYDLKSPNNPYYGHPIGINVIEYEFSDVNIDEYDTSDDFHIFNRTYDNVWIAAIYSTDPNVFRFPTQGGITPDVPYDLPWDAEVTFRIEFHPPSVGPIVQRR